MKTTLLLAAVAGLAFGTTASANTAKSVTNQCIFETRAAGTFSVAARSTPPVVTAGEGASALGAANVNDCIQDKYQVQYDTTRSSYAQPTGEDVTWWNVTYERSCPGGPIRAGNGYCFKR
jgi:hypothetical protein